MPLAFLTHEIVALARDGLLPARVFAQDRVFAPRPGHWRTFEKTECGLHARIAVVPKET